MQGDQSLWFYILSGGFSRGEKVEQRARGGSAARECTRIGSQTVYLSSYALFLSADNKQVFSFPENDNSGTHLK